MDYSQFISGMNHLLGSVGPEHVLKNLPNPDDLPELPMKLYVCGLLNYLGIEVPKGYKEYENMKLEKLYYPMSVHIMAKSIGGWYYGHVAKRAIPEFKRYGLIITEVGNAI